MKVLMRKLAARLPRLSSLTITAAGLCCVLGLGVLDYYTPGPMSFVLFYLFVVVLVGRRAGKWPAVFVSGVAVITMATVQWGLRRGAPQTGWVALWNNSTRFLVFSVAGWLTAEVTPAHPSPERARGGAHRPMESGGGTAQGHLHPAAGNPRAVRAGHQQHHRSVLAYQRAQERDGLHQPRLRTRLGPEV